MLWNTLSNILILLKEGSHVSLYKLVFLNNFDNQINKDGATRKFYPCDSLQLWHEELEPVNSLLDVMSASSPVPMVS